jgi:predicted amidohydrolase
MFKVSVAQMNSQDSVQVNLKTVDNLVSQAAGAGSTLILLPENFSYMGTEEGKLKISEEFGAGVIQDTIAALAQKHNIWILAGTIPIKNDDHDNDTQNKSKVFAASMLYDSNGRMVCRYDKIHLFDVKIGENEAYLESNTVTAGLHPKIYKSPFATIGFSVCYDLRFPELFRLYCNSGADIISIPSAFVYNTGKVHWHILNQARAIENQVYVLASDQDGNHPEGRKSYGHSMIVDPWGKIIVEQKTQVGIITADIDLQAMHKLRTSFPVLKHRRLMN